MALKKDITDSKGVKARYHRIKTIDINVDTLTVRVFSYINQETRDAEKKALDGNAKAFEYDQNIQLLRNELTPLIGNPDEDERVKELSEQINELEYAEDRPVYAEVSDTHYDEATVEIDRPEVFTLDTIYAEVVKLGRYAGSESI